MNSTPTLPKYILAHGMTIIPNISAMMVVYHDPDLGQIMLRKENQSTSPPATVEMFDPSMVKSLHGKQNWYWLTDSEMPFNRKRNSGQTIVNLFDEHKIRNLQINLLDDHYQCVMVCYYVFPENHALFGTSNDTTLSTINKQFISNVLINYLTSLRLQYRELLHFAESQKNRNKELELQLKNLYERFHALQQQEQSMREMYCRNRIQHYSQKWNANIEFSDEAMRELLRTNITINQIDTILASTLNRCAALYSDESHWVIQPWHLSFPSDQTISSLDNPSTKNETVSDRTLQLLDRLERASQRVVEKKLKLTSVNVGMHCDEPITAPAISDALKKHASKIARLLSLYPDRWPLLRSEFRPLLNLMDKDHKRFDVG
ncbi:MAG TPA: hypothetical protein PK990_00315 [Salinivirgaceae bacterium]|nr:hypothetical protein [Salinivirgaceae bacterium]